MITSQELFLGNWQKVLGNRSMLRKQVIASHLIPGLAELQRQKDVTRKHSTSRHGPELHLLAG